MFYKFICFFLFLVLSLNLSAEESQKHPLYCAQELQPTLETLRKLPEIEELVQRILQDGPLHIDHNDRLSKQFDGYWDPYHRTILITEWENQSEASRITTMLFEMHNALRSKEFKKIDQRAYKRELTKEQYMRMSEHVEYENCLSTSNLLNKGIQKGLFPKSSAWPVHDNFEDHYSWMKRSGHANWYANSYKNMR